jgi:diacylglycerol kinase (ATP)
VDVGRVEWSGGVYHFLNIVGIGFAVDAGLAALELKFAGRSAYTLGALWRMLRLRSYPLDMRVDGARVQQDNVFVEISNSRYTGTSFLMAPAAKLDDGLLDVTWLARVPRLRLAWLFRSIFSGRHVEYPEVAARQAREILLDAPPGYLLMADGEFEGRTPARITCLHRDLEMFC